MIAFVVRRGGLDQRMSTARVPSDLVKYCQVQLRPVGGTARVAA
jgi:hypothetical protein